MLTRQEEMIPQFRLDEPPQPDPRQPDPDRRRKRPSNDPDNPDRRRDKPSPSSPHDPQDVPGQEMRYTARA